MTTDVSERGLESLIVDYLVRINGYELGLSAEFNKDYAIDEGRLFHFLLDTQPEKVKELRLLESDIEKIRFLNRLSLELNKTGTINVLRNGIKHNHLTLQLFNGSSSEQNTEAKIAFNKNIFSVTRQLHYSKTDPKLSLDLAIFINGLPIITAELKNLITKQNVEHAVEQYQTDRDPKELIFQFKRCMVHFAADDREIKMCTKLSGKSSWFLPFNKGYNNGAGNPPNPNGIMTDYLWREILTKEELTNIIENYAQVIEELDEDTGKKQYKQLFPRYHQLAVVKHLLAEAQSHGPGGRYLIQHSAGSGKSNSIAWLAYQLVALRKNAKEVFDSIVVVTDRVNLDKQIRRTIRQFAQVDNVVGFATSSGELKRLLDSGKKIIITIVHKFPLILDDIAGENKGKTFAIIIDEAHSSQSGAMSAKMNIVLSGIVAEDYDDIEDQINKIIEGRRMLPNASYFAFTATPKGKTLEMFGTPVPDGDKISHRPFHCYTMKQAIEEGFILDVLKYYLPIHSFYKLEKIVEDDPKFDKKKAQKKLRAYVEANQSAIAHKAGIIVEHFHDNIISKGKIGGKARAMVVCGSILRAIEYYYALTAALEERRSPFRPIIAFSGEKEYNGRMVSDAILNGFPQNQIEKKFKSDPYRILIAADMFQTGFDEPLLHTMYVDKVLSGIKAVQTLSRLNRAAPQKFDTCILDFANDVEDIKKSFDDYYKTTILSEETDPNKLNDLIAPLEHHQVFTKENVNNVVEFYLKNSGREQIDPILDSCVKNYQELAEDDQVEFKGNAKSFLRTYNFLASILPFGNREWEKLSIFLNLLTPKLPSPVNEDLAKGILQTIDLDRYRAMKLSTVSIQLEDKDALISPVPIGTGGSGPRPELDVLTQILKDFHTVFGDIEWSDADKVKRQIAELPDAVAQNEAYLNAIANSDKCNARKECDRATDEAILATMTSGLEFFREIQNNPAFKKMIFDMVFDKTYTNAAIRK